jgi:ribonuclease D
MEIHWIDRADQLAEFCSDIDDQVVAVDSESDHFQAYRTRVCLLQVATRRRAALIDPLALDESELEPFFELCRAPDITKLLHSAHNDINEFDRDWGLGIEGLFDTQIAARFLGYRRNSLSWLVEEIVGESGPDISWRFDWTTRPLPDDARQYAADDVIHLFPLYDRFVEELDETGWRGPFDQQCRYVAAETSHDPEPFDPEGWREIDHAAGLEGRQRAVFRALYLWRHELCEELNRAAIHVFPDDVMAKVARREIDSAEDLAELDRLPDAIADEYAPAIVEVVEQGREAEIPAEEPPDREADEGRRPSPAERDRYDALREWRNRTADQLDIPSEFIATNATLSEVAANPPSDVEDLRQFHPILEWHRQMFGDEIVEAASD